MNTDGQLSLAPEVSVHSTDLVKTGVQEVEGKWKGSRRMIVIVSSSMSGLCQSFVDFLRRWSAWYEHGLDC
jgi:hypothetical protein